MLSLDDFRPVTLGDRELFQRHYALYPQTHSDNTFTNMVCWNHYAHYSYALVRGNIVLASTVDGVPHFRPPIGPRDPALLKDLIKLASEVSDGLPIILADRATSEWMKTVYGPLEFVEEPNLSEYVYLASDLAELPNGRYHSTRRQLARFRRDNAYTVEPVSPYHPEEAKEFLDRWCEWKDCQGDHVLENEREAIYYAVDHLAELGLSGLAIRVEGKVGALSLFERLNATTALIHFEKGNEAVSGIYKAINAETAAVLARDFTYVNRESDMGVPGLREAKRRYHPHHMVEVYSLRNPAQPPGSKVFPALREVS